VLDHAGDDFWPWPFLCRQEVTLEPRRLIVELAVTNLAPVTVPLSAGYHPYFCRDHAELSLMARAVWLIDPNQLPARSVMPTGHLDLSRRAPLGGRSIDNCYDGVSWPARIAWPQRGMTVSIAGSAALGSAVVYADAAADALCVEPVANSSNALNLDGDFLAMPEIAPQATLTVRCVMQIEDLEQG
jgi:aldose 1-epimerase